MGRGGASRPGPTPGVYIRFAMPEHCQGLTLEDGTKYSCPPGGTVEVEDPAHIAAILRSGNYQAGHIGRAKMQMGFWSVRGKERVCECGFRAFAWQDRCPRCGRGL